MGDKDRRNITLWCNATGNPQPSITWKKLGSSSIVLSNEKKLFLSRADASDTGAYLCSAKNDLGTTVSEEVHLNVVCMYYISLLCRTFKQSR